MLERSDLSRLLTEIFPQFESEEAISEWMDREGISDDVFNSVGSDITGIVAEDVMKNADNPGAGLGALAAGIQLAFFVGWECAKQYAPRGDMSQT